MPVTSSAQEAKLNRFKQFRASVGGLELHFIHERGKGDDPMPLVLTHGWPSTFFEMTKIVPLLADPAISDILVNSPKNIYIERGGKLALAGALDPELSSAGREAAIYLLNKKRVELGEIEQRYGVSIEVLIDESFEGARMSVESSGPRPVQRRPEPTPIEEDLEEVEALLGDEAEEEEEEEEEGREERGVPAGDERHREVPRHHAVHGEHERGGDGGEPDVEGRRRRFVGRLGLHGSTTQRLPPATPRKPPTSCPRSGPWRSRSLPGPCSSEARKT